MINFNNIREHEIDRLNVWSCLGSPADFDALPEEFKEQILFLDKEAEEFLYQYFETQQFHTGPMWDPYQKGNFKYIEKTSVRLDDKILKKWLYKRGISFSKWVCVLPNYGSGPLMMTWKMVIKNCESIFFADDVVIFDETNQWCLTYYHDDQLFFGKIKRTDPEIGYSDVKEMDELKRKFPGYKHPYKE